jgi:hypothetical protein
VKHTEENVKATGMDVVIYTNSIPLCSAPGPITLPCYNTNMAAGQQAESINNYVRIEFMEIKY